MPPMPQTHVFQAADRRRFSAQGFWLVCHRFQVRQQPGSSPVHQWRQRRCPRDQCPRQHRHACRIRQCMRPFLRLPLT